MSFGNAMLPLKKKSKLKKKLNKIKRKVIKAIKKYSQF